MHIRRMNRDDSELVDACRNIALMESPEAFLLTPQALRNSRRTGAGLDTLERELTSDHIHYFGAFEGIDLVGFMRFVRCIRPGRTHVAEVRGVYVKKAMRGKGIGGALFDYLIRDAHREGIESLILSVLVDNKVARKLYEHCGFVLYGIEPCAICREGTYIDMAMYRLAVPSNELP